MRPTHSSQAAWTEGEALERAGKTREALDLYIRGAQAEEDADQPLRARLLWEKIADRTGVTGTILERLAQCSGRAKLRDDCCTYWQAAAVRYTTEGRTIDALRAREHALRLQKAGAQPGERPKLAAAVLDAAPSKA